MEKIFSKVKEAYIFGAHSRGRNLKAYMDILYPDIEILGFLVSDREGNPDSIEGVPVKVFVESEKYARDAVVLLATRGIVQNAIAKYLAKGKFRDIIPVTVAMDNYLRNQFFRRYFAKQGLSSVKLEEWSHNKGEVQGKKKDGDGAFCIYMAKSIYDKSISNRELPGYIRTVQAGAALTDARIADVTDNMGENISRKNHQYSELTVLYWLWKHGQETYQGLCHYRRHFILQEDWIPLIMEEDIDAVLPVPSVCTPSVGENYCFRHGREDWEFLMTYLKKYLPSYYESARTVFEGKIYFTCNMFIMKKRVLDTYCKWLFPILEAVEKHIGQKEDIYQNRYPGFMAERLMTLYFFHHMKEFKIAYIDKVFIGE